MSLKCLAASMRREEIRRPENVHQGVWIIDGLLFKTLDGFKILGQQKMTPKEEEEEEEVYRSSSAHDAQVHVRADASLSVSVVLRRIVERLTSPKFRAALLCLWSFEEYNAFRKTLFTIQDIVDVETSGIRLIMSEELLMPRVLGDVMRLWMLLLSDALVQADDAMGDFANSVQIFWCKVEQGKMQDPPPPRGPAILPLGSPPIRRMNVFRNRLHQFMASGKIMTNIVDTLSNILRAPPPPPLPATFSTLPDTTVSALDQWRMQEKDHIIQLLLASPDTNLSYHVIPIVADEGLGKSIFAKIVYNDNYVQQHFDLTMWVSISSGMDFWSLIESIIQHSTTTEEPSPPRNILKLNLLQAKLVRRLRGKKFLLVLDNFSNQICCDWDDLRHPFKAGARGSAVIVTTRSLLVSSIVATVPPHHLKPLTPENSWLLFESLASRGILSSNDDLRTCQQGIKDLGWAPPVAMALGNFLQSEEMGENKFDTINTRLFRTLYHEKSDIPTTLRLAYYCLPAHLKQCFAYCAMFDRRCSYKKNTLVWLWMAEGFIEQKPGMTVEEVGISYFEELLENSFFEPHRRIRRCGRADLFLVPEHAHHLAELVLGNKLCRLDVQNSCVSVNSSGVSEQSNVDYLYFTKENFSRRNILGTRHLSFWNSSFGLEEVSNMVGPNGLHSLLIGDGISGIYFSGVPRFCQKLKWLRTLNLTFALLTYLPDSIGELQNLRYLDISGSEIPSLPESFTTLYNLQTLRAEDLKRRLVFPKEVWKLVNLRHLDFGVDVKFSMPPGLGGLVSLHTLSGFVVPKSSETMIRELKDLKNLQTLIIKNLDGVLHMDEAKEANLWDKQCLNKLHLQWTKRLDSKIAEDVLAGLKPFTSIYSLAIFSYSGAKFASWLGDLSYSKLETIHLCCCWSCKTLPTLGNLPSLKHLYMHHMIDVQVVNKEFYGHSTGNAFSSLITLEVVDLCSLEEWTGLEKGDMPCLSQLRIEGCNNLNALPSLKFMGSLRFLDIISCPELQYLQMERLPSSVESLTVRNCPILSKRCKRQVGEDWHTISQIPKLAIDGI